MAIDVIEEQTYQATPTPMRHVGTTPPVEISREDKATTGQPDPAMLEKINVIRTRLQATFGQVVLALTAVPRYQHQSVGDLSHLVLEPLIRDRVAIATSKPKDEPAPQGPLAGIAIWASVSDEVDVKIQDQIKAGVFPIRLQPEDWSSGDTVWLLDVIAPTKNLATALLTNFRQVAKKDQIRMHPLVARMVDPVLMKTMSTEHTGAQGKSETPKSQQHEGTMPQAQEEVLS